MIDWLLLLVLIAWPRTPERTLGEWMCWVERQQLACFGRVVPTPTTEFVHRWYRRYGKVHYGGVSIRGGVRFRGSRRAKIRRAARALANHRSAVILSVLLFGVVAYVLHAPLSIVPVPVVPLVAKTWAAAAADTWSDSPAWSPNGIPAAGDDVTFNSTSVQNCTVDVATNALNSLTVGSTYTGQISASAAVNVNNTGTSSFSLAGGTFLMNAQSLAVGDLITVTGGTLDLGSATVAAIRFTFSGGTVADATSGAFNLTLSRDDGGDAISYSAGSMALFSGTIALTGNSNLRIPSAATTSVRAKTLSIAALGKTTTINQGGAAFFRIPIAETLVTGGGTVSTNATGTQQIIIFSIGTGTSNPHTALSIGAGTTFRGQLDIFFDPQSGNVTVNIPGFAGYPAVIVGGFSATQPNGQTFLLQGAATFTGSGGLPGFAFNAEPSSGSPYLYKFDMQGFSMVVNGLLTGPTGGTLTGNLASFKTSNGSLTVNGGLATGSGTWAGAGTWDFRNSPVAVSGNVTIFASSDYFLMGTSFSVGAAWTNNSHSLSWSSGQSTVAFVGSSPQTIAMGGLSFYNVALQGGDKFFTQSFACNNLTQNGVPLTMTLTAGITWTLNGTITGPLLGLFKLRSSSPGSPWLLVATHSTAIAVDVQDSNASGGATMTGTFSLDSGGNTNWVFTPAPAPLIGQACAGGTLVLTPLPPAPPARPLPATFVTQPAVFFDRCLGIYVNANGTPAKQPGT